MSLFEKLNSSETTILAFDTETVTSGIPTTYEDGEDLIQSDGQVVLGVNLDNFNIYRFTGEEWVKCGK